MENPRVGFVIGGAQKAGTTALAHYLAQHPVLALPRTKEAHVFDAPGFVDGSSVRDVDAMYQAHFDPDPAKERLHGDATPIYMFHPKLVKRIASYNPAMKWILILRHPVERAYSHYQMECRRGDEQWPFWAAMLFERWRLHGHRDDLSMASPLRRHSYRARGDYAAQLDVLYAHFPECQILRLRSEALSSTPVDVLSRIHDFLGVARMPIQSFDRVFQGGYSPLTTTGARWRALTWLMRRELAEARERYGLEWH